MISRSYPLYPVCLLVAMAGLPPYSSGQQSGLSQPAPNHFLGKTNTVSIPATRPQNLSPEARGDIYMARKMYREAIDTFREGPTDSAILTNKIGIAYHQMMQLDIAKKNYEKAIKLNSKYTEAINNLGTVFYAKKNHRKAIRYYKRALKISPRSASILSNLGTAYFAKRDYKHAAECYEQALLLDPEVFERRSQYGVMLQERSVEERAKFHLYLAKTYAKAGRVDRAVDYLRKAFEEGLKDPKKVAEMPEFSMLKENTAFQELLAAAPKPL